MLLFTIWNLKSTITYKGEQVVLSRTSVYFAISKLILLLSYYFHVPCLILFNIYFYILHLFNRSLSKASVVKWVIFFLFNFLKMVIFTTLFRRWSTLWNSTLKIMALLNVLSFNVDVVRRRDVISTWQQRLNNIAMFAGSSNFQGICMLSYS